MQGLRRWDDLALVLALLRAGSLAGAARELGCDASTISRRLRALEEALGGPVFHRTPDGLVAAPLAERLRPYAERAEASILAAQAEAASTDTSPAGTVRVAMSSELAAYVVAPSVSELQRRHPRLRLEILVSNELADLTRREADVALRSVRPTRGDLVAQRLGGIGRLAAVARRDYIEGLAPGERVRWLAFVPELGHLPDARLFDRLVGQPPDVASNDMVALVECLRAGAGAMLLPASTLAHPELAEVPGYEATEIDSPVWLVCHRALRDVPRVRVVWEWMQELLRGALGAETPAVAGPD